MKTENTNEILNATNILTDSINEAIKIKIGKINKDIISALKKCETKICITFGEKLFRENKQLETIILDMLKNKGYKIENGYYKYAYWVMLDISLDNINIDNKDVIGCDELYLLEDDNAPDNGDDEDECNKSYCVCTHNENKITKFININVDDSVDIVNVDLTNLYDNNIGIINININFGHEEE